MYLLKTLSEVIRNSKDIPPREFDEKGTHSIVECWREIRKRFVGESERNASNWWNEWDKEYVTPSKDYVAHLARNSKVYFFPLAEYLFGLLIHWILHGDQNYLFTSLISILDFNGPLSFLLEQFSLLNQNLTLIYPSHDQLLSIIVCWLIYSGKSMRKF